MVRPGYKISLAFIVAAILVAQFVSAQSDEWRDASEAKKPELKLVQDYKGTVPGTGNNLPKVEELKGKKGTWVTWPGFVMTGDGGSRIFLQTTKSLEYKQTAKGKKIILTFKNTKVHLWNNSNPLITSHFNTPVKKVYLKRKRKQVDMIIELKSEAEPTIVQTEVGDGYHYLFVNFAKGQYDTGSTGSARPSFSGGGSDAGQVEDEESPFE